MSALDDVKLVNAAIQAIPKEYRALILTEQTWAASHPAMFAVALIALGFLLGLIAYAVL